MEQCLAMLGPRLRPGWQGWKEGESRRRQVGEVMGGQSGRTCKPERALALDARCEPLQALVRRGEVAGFRFGFVCFFLIFIYLF